MTTTATLLTWGAVDTLGWLLVTLGCVLGAVAFAARRDDRRRAAELAQRDRAQAERAAQERAARAALRPVRTVVVMPSTGRRYGVEFEPGPVVAMMHTGLLADEAAAVVADRAERAR